MCIRDSAYSVESLAWNTPYDKLLGHLAGDSVWTPEVYAHYTQAPDDPRYAELAKGIVAQLPPELAQDPFAQALAIKLWLDKNMKYTRKERHKDAEDPTADFLFGDLKGYCVHSSHALVY